MQELMISLSRCVPTRRTWWPLSLKGQAMAVPIIPAPTIATLDMINFHFLLSSAKPVSYPVEYAGDSADGRTRVTISTFPRGIRGDSHLWQFCCRYESYLPW